MVAILAQPAGLATTEGDETMLWSTWLMISGGIVALALGLLVVSWVPKHRD